MAFPSPASDGQQVIVGNVTYSYNATKTAWYRVGTVSNPITSTVDYYTADGVTDTFALTAVPSSENYTFVAVGGVLQPRDRYSILGTYLTFSSVPPAGVPIDITTFGGSGASVYSNNSVATYLMHYTGNVTANSIIADSFYWSNGAPFVSSIYGDSNVAAYVAGTTFDNIYGANIWATSNLISYGGMHVQGNIIPLASNIYNIGSPSYRFGSLYLAGNTIDLGGTTLTTVANGTAVLSNNLIVNGNIIDGSGLSISSYSTLANATITTANSSMKSYVDAQVIASSGYSNVAAAAYLSVTNPVYVGNIKSNTNIIANGNIIGGGVRSTASSTPPANPVPGDTWFNTTENLLYRYVNDGTRSVWIDISGPTYTFDWQSNVSFAGNLMPAADVTYYIGNASQRFVSLHSANIYTTNGVFWANGNSYSSGSGASSSTIYGLSVAFGIGL